MIYLLENPADHTDAFQNIDLNSSALYLCLLRFDQLDTAKKYFLINENALWESKNYATLKFESHEGLDYIALNIPDRTDPLLDEEQVGIYFTKHLLIFVSKEPEKIKKALSGTPLDAESTTLEKILYDYFNALTIDDHLLLDNIEQEIFELEEKLITSGQGDYIKAIITLRKKLLVLKRYYEQLFDVAEAIEENQNHLIGKKELRYFRMLTNRIDRLSHTVLHLRDYATQIREAYQAQVDINLNNIMRVFTVITAIFLPLTLLVGWYGMNFQMPEYSWSFGYPAVIVVSIIVVALCFVLFKKNKWF